MTIILDPYQFPEKGPVEIRIERSFTIKVTAEEAQRQVNQWLRNNVSYLMRALPPTLVIGDQVVWRVPASIGFPHMGQVGTIGAVEVDVETGLMDNTPERKAEIEHYAQELASRLPPYEPKSETPAACLAKNMPPAPKLVITEDGYLQLAGSEEIT